MAISNSTTKRGYMTPPSPGAGTGQSGATSGNSRGFNINDFRAHRDQVGILRNHDYHIEIPLPEGLIRNAALTDIARNIELTCDSVNFPATGLQTYKVQRYSYGASETKPTVPIFANLECTFLCDQKSNLWKFFHDWMQVAVNYDFDPNPVIGGTMAVYEISYKHEYAVDMYLYIYDPFGTLVRKVGFRESYPIAVQDVVLSWAVRDQLVRIPVSFTFFDWNEYDVLTGQPAA
jgi:hypothetical protein